MLAATAVILAGLDFFQVSADCQPGPAKSQGTADHDQGDNVAVVQTTEFVAAVVQGGQFLYRFSHDSQRNGYQHPGQQSANVTVPQAGVQKRAPDEGIRCRKTRPRTIGGTDGPLQLRTGTRMVHNLAGIGYPQIA